MGKVSDSKKHTLTKGQQHTGEVIVGGQRLDYTIDAKPISTTPSKMASNEWKTIKLHFVPKKSGTKIQFFGSHEVGCSLVRNIKITQCEKLLDGCQKNCQGYSCDYWSTEENYSCALLEKDYGCNCNGCICKVDTEACANDKCQGKSCDDWVQLGRWPCSYLKKTVFVRVQVMPMQRAGTFKVVCHHHWCFQREGRYKPRHRTLHHLRRGRYQSIRLGYCQQRKG